MSAICLPASSSDRIIKKTPARPRQAMLDLARVLAAYSIIWLHGPHIAPWEDSRAIGRFAVPLFVMVTILMVFESIAHKPQQAWRQYAWSRFLRIYMPFMAWNGIYIAFKLLKGRFLPGDPNDYPGLDIFWAGACWHLWFLPFILFVSLLAFAIAKGLHARPDVAPSAALAGLVAGCVLMYYPSVASLAAIGEYWEIIGNVLPAVAWGLAMAATCQLLGTQRLKQRITTLLAAVLVVICLACVWSLGRSRVFETLAGLGMLVVALAPLQTTWCQRLAKLGPLTMGIYLSHVLWLKVIEVAANKAGMPVTGPRDVAIFLAVVAASTVTAWLLSRYRATRWLAA